MPRHILQLLTILFLLISFSALAQQEAKTRQIDFEGMAWEVNEFGDAGPRAFLGRQAMFLERSQLTPLDLDFSQGVIEFELATEHASGFVGLNFRDNGQGTSEQFYVRFHQSGRPDASQYLARLNSLASWQLHAGPNDATAVELGTNEWIPVKIVVVGDKADIFVRDMETPALHIAQLRTDNDQGKITFYAFERPEMITGAYISNISIRPLHGGERLVGTPREEPGVPDTVFNSWLMSSPISEAQLSGTYTLDPSIPAGLEWSEQTVESNGILNIARFVRKTPEADTVLVRLVLHSDSETSRQLNFGYSDRIRIYVNGKQQFYGNAQWRSRDHRFLGTVGLHDAVILNLDSGNNEIIAAVSESFGGWGFTGQLADRDELTINP